MRGEEKETAHSHIIYLYKGVRGESYLERRTYYYMNLPWTLQRSDQSLCLSNFRTPKNYSIQPNLNSVFDIDIMPVWSGTLPEKPGPKFPGLNKTILCTSVHPLIRCKFFKTLFTDTHTHTTLPMQVATQRGRHICREHIPG